MSSPLVENHNRLLQNLLIHLREEGDGHGNWHDGHSLLFTNDPVVGCFSIITFVSGLSFLCQPEMFVKKLDLLEVLVVARVITPSTLVRSSSNHCFTSSLHGW